MQTVLTIIIVLAFGVVFERYFFCMNSAISDAFISRDTRKLKGLLTAVLVSAVLFNILIGLGALKASRWPLFSTAIAGGLIFGIGMVLAGGCVSGTLFKMGQGHVASFIAFSGIVLGLATIGLAMSMVTMAGSGAKPLVGATLPNMLGVNPLFFAALSAALCLWAFMAWKRKAGALNTTVSGIAGRQARLKSPNYLAGGLLIAVLNTALFAVQGYPLMMSGLMIYIPSRLAFMFDSAWAAKNPMFGGFLDPGHEYVMMALTGVFFIAGAFLSSLLSKRFRIRLPVLRQAISSLIGGYLMGLAIPLMWGCNVTHILGNVPQFSAASLVSAAGIVAGAWLGIKLITRLAAPLIQGTPEKAPGQ